MSYQVLARKWRPRKFSELVGQEHVRRALVNALDHDRLHHAYLFTGTRGVGKTTIARILAKALNCEAGVSSNPCGHCGACAAIDAGRFVDLIEVDAASRTKVEDTRELLENVQYAPTQGRYKVYLIDEVHMLSGHSFNALLKTLEEPPPHVKFLLATTDPQRLPVTILSRCLQFNLKSLSPVQIAGQLETVLGKEQVPAEEGAVRDLAHAADGSMRDALSLLDQAIAFGGGQLAAADVRTLLGTIDRDSVYRLLQSLAAADAAGLLAEIVRIDEFTPDYAALLAELLSVLQRIAIAQMLPDAIDDSHGDRAAVLELADSFPVEDVQLYYQIGLIGRRDLSLSPEPRGGFEMLLLRMLAFRPAAGEQNGGGVRTAAANLTAGVVVEPSRGGGAVSGQVPVPPQGEPDSGEWHRIVERLNLRGITRELALNCALQEAGEQAVVLTLDPAHLHLCNEVRTKQIEKALAAHYGRPVKLKIVKARALAGETPARRKAREREMRQQQAVQSIEDDENIKALQETFGATVNYNSIRPRDQEETGAATKRTK